MVDLFLGLESESALIIRQKLLETLAQEQDTSVRNKISDAVAEVARQYSDSSKCLLFQSPYYYFKEIRTFK